MLSKGLDMSGKRCFVFLLVSLLLLCLAGCELVDVDGNPITPPTAPETREWDGLELDPELRKAIDEKSSCVLWRIPEAFRPEGTAAVRPYETLDCTELWPELKDFVFPDARMISQTQKNGVRVMAYSDGTQSFTVQLNAVSLFLEGLPQEQAATALEQIKIFLEQKACFPLAEWTGPAPDAQDLTYGLLLDGIPVDVKMDSPLPVSCVFEQPNGKLILWNPILPGEPSERFDLGDCLSEVELRSTAVTGREKGIPMAAELTECNLINYLDGDAMTLRPGWSLTGTGYRFDTGKMEPIEILIDAITGKGKRVH